MAPDCGTTFTWVTKAFGPRSGWMGGWVLTIAGITVLANLAQVAAQYTFLLVGADSLADSTFWVTVLGVAFIVVMTYVSFRGIEIAHWLQNVLVGIQYVALAVLVVVAFAAVAGVNRPDTAIDVQASWFNPFEFFADGGGGFAALTEGMLLMIFIYWGWDTILALNEETKGRDKTPVKAAVVATLILLATYLLTSVAAVSYAGVGEEGIGLGNEENAGDVFRVIGEPILGSWDWLVLLAVLVSAAASTQTTILPAARGTLAMGVYRALPKRFSSIHPRYRTPSFSTLVIGIVASTIFVMLSLLGENVYGDVLLALSWSGETVELRPRPADRLLLRPDGDRLRLVFPQGHRRRRVGAVDEGSAAPAGRAHTDFRVHQERHRHVGSGLRIPRRLDCSRPRLDNRQCLPARHRLYPARYSDHDHSGQTRGAEGVLPRRGASQGYPGASPRMTPPRRLESG